MSIVVKVQHKDELRRISVDPTISLSSLKAKLGAMFALSESDFVITDQNSKTTLMTDLQCQEAFSQTSQRWEYPQVLRLLLEEPICELDTLTRCTQCGGDVKTVYYKCINCPSVELCESCESQNGHAEGKGHLFVKLRQSYKLLSPEQQLVFESHLEPQEITTPKEMEPLNMSMMSELMSEFQEVVAEPDKPIDNIEQEIATWEEAQAVTTGPINPLSEEIPEGTVTVERIEEKEVDSAQSSPQEKPNPFKQNLATLESMGFTDREKNIALLVKHVNNLESAVEELLHGKVSWLDRLGL